MHHVTTPTNAAPISHTEALGAEHSLSALITRALQTHEAHEAACTALGLVENKALAGEFAKNGPEITAAERAEEEASNAATAAYNAAMSGLAATRQEANKRLELYERFNGCSIEYGVGQSIVDEAGRIDDEREINVLLRDFARFLREGDTFSALDAGANGRCEAAQVWRELQLALDAELKAEAEGDNAKQESYAEQRDRLEHKLATVQATSSEGALAQLVIAIDFAEMVRGNSGDQATCDRYHDLIEAMSKSAFRVLGAQFSDQIWSCYIGGQRTAPRITDDATVRGNSLTALLEKSDRYFSEACGHPSDTPEARQLDDKADELHRQFLRAPINSDADAIAKLRWLNRANFGGQTGHEPAVVAQLVAYLGGDPVAVLTTEPHDECATVADLTLTFDRDQVSDPALLIAAE